MLCPNCSVEASQGSQFCEECGSALAAPSSMSSTPASPADPKLRCPGCGAGPGSVDDGGFCTRCGARRLSPSRDHFEEVLSRKAAGASDIGLKHDENQDYFVLAAAKTGDPIVFLCDGVSQSQNAMQGAKAACDAALASILDDLKENGETAPISVLEKAMLQAQAAICNVPFVKGITDTGGDDPEPIPPAQSTAVGVVVTAKRITISWVGDSRAYWVDHDGARQLTTDHSWFNEVVGSGEMTAEEALNDKRSRAIVRSLGADPDGANSGVEPDTLTLNITEKGVLLIVSDGLYVYADAKKIAEIVNQRVPSADALSLSRALVDYARDGGGRDNITVVALFF
jgi:serine/threonine protein phosphatase PrpC